MPTPPKPVIVLESERKSHRTKQELEKRKKEEASLLTGSTMKVRAEVKKNKIANTEFKRIKKLLGAIGKDDAIYESVINRYCAIYAECMEYESRREEFCKGMEELREEYNSGKIDKEEDLKPSTYYKLLRDMQKNVTTLDGLSMSKRKMLLDIEKESAMTIAAALRSIPKKTEEDEIVKNDPMSRVISRRV